MTRAWARAAREALENAALGILGDKRASAGTKAAAKAALAAPRTDVTRLDSEQLATWSALTRIMRGEVIGDLYIRHVAERPRYRSCPECTERRGRVYVEITWADEVTREAIAESIESLKRGDTTHGTTEADSTEAIDRAGVHQLGDVDREGAPTSTDRPTDATADGTGG